MRIAIWGAGGIGCYYGARLEQTGHSVTYIARGKHLSAMQSNGLQVHHSDLKFNQTVTAVSQEQLLTEYQCDDFDLIILAIKNTATTEVLKISSDWLKKGQALVLSLQNGVDNEPEIADAIGKERTLGGLAVRIGGHIIEPGVVEATGVAQVIFGAWPNQRQNTLPSEQLDNIQNTFVDAGIPSQITPDIQRELWRKLIINNGVNPLSALAQLDTRSLTQNPVLRSTVYKMMQETAAAAASDGLELDVTDIDEMFELICNFDAIKTSMLVDREKGRPLELDGISGTVLHRSKSLGIEAPTTALVSELLRLATV